MQYRAAAEPALRKFGSAFCKDIAADRAFTHVALRVRVTPAAPWSERNNSAYERAHSDLSLGIYTLDRDVANTGLYLARLRP